jgi:ATP-dependent DNA helicase RecQ
MPVAATVAASSQHNPPDVLQALHDIFGFGEFRALQQEAVQAALDGRDVLVVMPTGAGKSLCFQLPAAISDGVTLVVSPLVALMRDQVDALKNRTAFAQLGCAYINSLQSAEEQRFLVDQLRDGHLKLVYVAPERFRSPAFLDALRSTKIARFVVDEAHCISEWGHDFRPDYLSMRSVVDELGRPPLLAVTATATLRVQQSIVDNLGMNDPLKLVGGFNRPNLHFSAHRCKSETERQEKLMRALPKLAQMGGSGLIYVATRKQCDEVAAIATKALAAVGKRAAPYHAGMEASTRNALQSGWIQGDIHVLVATTRSAWASTSRMCVSWCTTFIPTAWKVIIRKRAAPAAMDAAAAVSCCTTSPTAARANGSSKTTPSRRRRADGACANLPACAAGRRKHLCAFRAAGGIRRWAGTK